MIYLSSVPGHGKAAGHDHLRIVLGRLEEVAEVDVLVRVLVPVFLVLLGVSVWLSVFYSQRFGDGGIGGLLGVSV